MHSPQASLTPDAERGRDEIRARILSAAIDLLTRGGRDAVTTRAVADAAGVQPPVLYRLFGDKQSLLEAVAEHGFSAYLAQKQPARDDDDPVDALRRGWDLHLDFGLTNPALYLLMYAEPQPGKQAPAAEAAFRILGQHIRRVAASGRLRVSEAQAAQLYHASAVGMVLLLLSQAEAERDPALSSMAREAALTAITTDKPKHRDSGRAASAIALKATLDESAPLTAAERSLLAEWLDRLTKTPPPQGFCEDSLRPTQGAL